MVFQKGHKPYKVNLGKHWKMSDITKQKLSLIHKGKKLSEETKTKIKQNSGKYWTGKNLSDEHKNKIRIANTGKNNWHWKGGDRNKIRTEKLEIIAGRKKPELCELCGRNEKICFDHDHKTGKFRGWICQKCNACLGMANDNIQTLELMIEYIKNNQTKN